MINSDNLEPSFFGKRGPIYPDVAQLLRVTGPAVDPINNVYPAFVQQANMPSVGLRDREQAYLWEPNFVPLVPFKYRGRLLGTYNNLPLYATSQRCCRAGSPSSPSSSSQSLVPIPCCLDGTLFLPPVMTFTIPAGGDCACFSAGATGQIVYNAIGNYWSITFPPQGTCTGTTEFRMLCLEPANTLVMEFLCNGVLIGSAGLQLPPSTCTPINLQFFVPTGFGGGFNCCGTASVFYHTFVTP